MESLGEASSPELALHLFHQRTLESEEPVGTGVDDAIVRLVRGALARQVRKGTGRRGIEQGAGDGQLPQGGRLHIDVGGPEPVPALQRNALQQRKERSEALAVVA